MLKYTQPIAEIEVLNENDIVRTSSLTASDSQGVALSGNWNEFFQ